LDPAQFILGGGAMDAWLYDAAQIA